MILHHHNSRHNDAFLNLCCRWCQCFSYKHISQCTIYFTQHISLFTDVMSILSNLLDSNFHMKLHDLPIDIVRYQLLPFLKCASAVNLTKSSQFHFHTLRHKFHRPQQTHFLIDSFIEQSLPMSKRIGLCSSVSIQSKSALIQLVKYFTDPRFIKVHPVWSLEFNINKSLGTLALFSSLHTLTFGDNFDKSMYGVKLPANLHTLSFGSKFNQSLSGITLPNNLHALIFGWDFNQSLCGITFPLTLLTLTFGGCFNKALSGVSLPANLHTLTFGWCFNQDWYDVSLPASLHTLSFSYHFNKDLTGITLPSSLRILILGYAFKKSLVGIPFPPQLKIRKYGALLGVHLLPPGLNIQYQK